MASTSAKSEVIPVKKSKESERFNPRHLLTPFEDMERWAEDIFPRNWLREHRWEWPSAASFSTSLETRVPKVSIAKTRFISGQKCRVSTKMISKYQ